jgi:hypothetical protein
MNVCLSATLKVVVHGPQGKELMSLTQGISNKMVFKLIPGV